MAQILLGVGTTFKYYIKEGSNFNDITPLRETTSAGDATFAKVANRRRYNNSY